MPSWAKITSRLAVTPASDSSVLVRWRLSCWAPSGMAAAVLRAQPREGGASDEAAATTGAAPEPQRRYVRQGESH